MRLVATSGDQMLSFPLRQGSTLVGRHPSCHVCIPAKGLSRRHCQVFVDGVRAVLRDLGSSNGTFVNNQRVERTELRDGDVISLGGFQFRFDAEGAAAPAAAFAQATEATEEIVVTARPSDAPPEAPAEPFVDPRAPHDAYAEPAAGQPGADQGVPPPTDFPAEPEGDETPVDNAFVPAPYTGQQTFGLAQQPQLVVRDGRWFLRDPRTGREVEIAPTGGAGAVAAPAEAARRPNVKLLLPVVGAAVLVVLAFTFIVFSGNGNGKTNGAKYSTLLYNKLVVAGVESVRKANKTAGFEARQPLFEEALERLEQANKRRPDIYTARLLAQYVRLRIDAAGDMSKFNWREARNYLDSVTNVFSASDEAVGFVKEEIRWIDYEQTCIGMGAAAFARLTGDDSNETLKDVYAELGRLPEDSWARKHYEPKRQEIRKTLFERHMSRGRQAMGDRKWEDAIRFFHEAEPYADDKATIKQQIALCQRYTNERDQFTRGEQAYGNKDFAVAKVEFQAIPDDSPYAPKAKSYLRRIETETVRIAREAVHKQALELYRKGAGDEAGEVIDKNDLKDLAYIKQRVQQITDLIAAGQAAEKEKLFKKAQALYQQATDVEPDAQNAYRRRAEALKADLEARFAQIGADFARDGYKHINDEPQKARELFDRARQYDPEQPRALRGLDHLQRAAIFLYNQGVQYLKKSDYAEARRAFDDALERADPASDLAGRIKQEIERLP